MGCCGGDSDGKGGKKVFSVVLLSLLKQKKVFIFPKKIFVKLFL